MHGLITAAWLACAVLGFCSSGYAATNEVQYERAMKLLKSGTDNARAATMLEEAAVDGDIRSILMLGALLLEGKYVPQDRVKGYAYLQIASETDYPPYKPIREQALKWMASSQATMTGNELIEADKVAAQWSAAFQQRLSDDFAPAVAAFTAENPLSYDPIIRFARETVQLNPDPAEVGSRSRSGCAAKPRPGCPAASKRLEVPHCTGTIPTPDSAPNAVAGQGALLVAPDLPEGVRRDGDSGTVKLLVHVDRSGWVCRAVVARSSGVPALDASAVDAVGLWKLNPALRHAEPVEALHILAVTFRVD